jgi:hypothetical protein
MLAGQLEIIKPAEHLFMLIVDLKIACCQLFIPMNYHGLPPADMITNIFCSN